MVSPVCHSITTWDLETVGTTGGVSTAAVVTGMRYSQAMLKHQVMTDVDRRPQHHCSGLSRTDTI